MTSKENLTSQRMRLTWRQKQCLYLIAEGLTARAIAVELGISVRTVREHLRGVRETLGAVSTSQAVHLAFKMGLLK